MEDKKEQIDFGQYKHHIENFLQTYYGVNTRKNFRCLNPMHSDDKPSMGYDKTSFKAHCFGCQACYDIYDLVGLYFKIDNKGEQYKKVQELYGYGCTTKPTKKVAKPKEPGIVPQVKNIKKYIEECKNNIFMTDYFKKRGLTQETIERCNLGYDSDKKTVVIPYSKQLEYYQSRSVIEKKFYKPPKEIAGEEPLYNAQALRLKTRKPIFVVESPICAMSIIQAGGNAVALGGSGENKLITYIKAKKPLGAIVLSLDNDDPGQQTTSRIILKLKELDVKYTVKNISDNYKDPNELLMANPTRFEKNVLTTQEEAKKLTATKFDNQRLEDIYNAKYPPMEWIVDKLIPKGLSLLASPPKFGKSYLMLQMTQAVAEGKSFLGFNVNKNEVDYFALEDTKERINSRAHMQRKDAPMPSGAYITLRAPTMDKDKLLDILAERLEEYPKIKLFIIDTLQKIRRTSPTKIDENNPYKADYSEIGQLKEFADDNGVGIVVVHHTRKAKDELDPYMNILGSIGLQGVVDTLIVLGKVNENSVMYYKGRDMGENKIIIDFDNESKGGTATWSVLGSPEEQDKQYKENLYNKNPVVKTIKELLRVNPNGWDGTATEFMEAMTDIVPDCTIMRPAELGKEIQLLHNDLYKDGIIQKSSRTNRTRNISFKKKTKPSYLMYSSPNYQPNMLEEEE